MITVSFTDVSTPGDNGPITAWEWHFGDGDTDTVQNPTHDYANPGTYDVTLKVTDSIGQTSTVTKPVSVTSLDVLRAAFSGAVSGLVITVTDLSTAGPSGPITDWDWDWGDGSSHGSGQSPGPHTYASDDTYTVTLTVTGTSPDGTDDTSHDFHAVGGGATFWTTTFEARPTTWAGTSSPHQKTFTTFAELKTKLAAAVAGDYLKYAGTGVLDVASASAVPWKLTDINPSGDVTVDFGTRSDGWDPSNESGDYVSFRYTGSSQFEAWTIERCSNLIFYGGSFDSGIGGGAIRVWGEVDNVRHYGGYTNKSGKDGLMRQPVDSHTGASKTISNCKWRLEINRPCMNPKWDTHADKGTGIHGVLDHAACGHITDNDCFVYVHDPLLPGESSAGQTWPEGALGSGIEIGTDTNGQPTSQSGNRYALLLENALMECTGDNPGSGGAKQTGGNGFNCWGSVPIDFEILWVECNNISGQCVKGTAGGWHTGSPKNVRHGRSTNTNQAYPLNNLSSSTDPYDRRWGINYADCT